MNINRSLFIFLLCLPVFGLYQCTTVRPGAIGNHPPPGTKPNTKPGKYEPMDTVRWSNPTNPKPPIKNDPTRPQEGNGQMGNHSGDTYRVALLLPFLTNASDETAVPEKSRLALQFYSGVKIALEQQTKERGAANIILDVYDAPLNDAEFQTLLNDRNLGKAQVIIGPVRSTQVQLAAAWAKQNRKILVSPESPNAGLAVLNPDFIQINPSLRAHCEGITQFIEDHYRGATVTLLCKTKEADRLPYFHDYRKGHGQTPFTEWVVPDETANFEKFDFKPYFKSGKTAVFILPTWANQDFVMAFFRKLKAVKGNTPVVVFGMPQWKGFESIEPEFLTALNVHISSAVYLNYTLPDVQAYQQAFYDATGTIPDEDGFNGYDVTRLVCNMLNNYGLSFPDRLVGTAFRGLHGPFKFGKVFSTGATDDASNRFDYLENKYIHILKFDRFGFVPVE
jgi:hypothetical protein